MRRAPATIPTTSVRPNGETVHRLINRARWKGKVQQEIAHGDEGVPQASVEQSSTDPQAIAIEAKLLELLEQRPVWTRPALLNQLTVDEARFVNKSVSRGCAWTLAWAVNN